MSHCFLEAFERVPKSKAAEYEQLSRDTDLEVKRSEPGHLIHAQTKIAEDENEIVYRWLEIYKDADALKAHFDNPVVATLTISNDTTDDNGGNADLTDLTLNSIDITGADNANFDLLNFTPGQVIAKGGSFDLQIELDPAGLQGLFDALLMIQTDQGAGLGGDGNDFQFTLAGESIPEPASLTIFAALGLLAIRRLRTVDPADVVA